MSRPGMAEKLRDNIARLTEKQREDRARAPLGHKIADWVARWAGSIPFVLVHLVGYSLWIGLNVSGIAHFDRQLVMLGTEASVEAIFLTTFILIAQNRMQLDADRRADLDLHINLLTEHELTNLARLVERIAERIGVTPDRAEFDEITDDVEPIDVLDALDATRRERGL